MEVILKLILKIEFFQAKDFIAASSTLLTRNELKCSTKTKA
jgi:hypothetical protein